MSSSHHPSDLTSGRVYVGLGDLNALTFGRAMAQDVTIRSDAITRQLNAGSALTLQASNDITVNSAITANNAAGNGGHLTLQAGRSILVNAAITTDNGNLTLIGNDRLANGVVDAQRDAGAAVITLEGRSMPAAARSRSSCATAPARPMRRRVPSRSARSRPARSAP